MPDRDTREQFMNVRPIYEFYEYNNCIIFFLVPVFLIYKQNKVKRRWDSFLNSLYNKIAELKVNVKKYIYASIIAFGQNRITSLP